MAFAENLCALMQARGMNSAKLAKELGVHISTITNWKSGRHPAVQHLQRVSEYFDVPIDQLLASRDNAS